MLSKNRIGIFKKVAGLFGGEVAFPRAQTLDSLMNPDIWQLFFLTHSAQLN